MKKRTRRKEVGDEAMEKQKTAGAVRRMSEVDTRRGLGI